MTLLLNDQAGIWRCSLGAEDAALKWVRIDAIDRENSHPSRSFHV
jgi:hypothetical protein